MSSLSCRLCGQPIKFDEKWVSERTRKKIPLDPGTNEPNDCPVRRDQPQRQVQTTTFRASADTTKALFTM